MLPHASSGHTSSFLDPLSCAAQALILGPGQPSHVPAVCYSSMQAWLCTSQPTAASFHLLLDLKRTSPASVLELFCSRSGWLPSRSFFGRSGRPPFLESIIRPLGCRLPFGPVTSTKLWPHLSYATCHGVPACCVRPLGQPMHHPCLLLLACRDPGVHRGCPVLTSALHLPACHQPGRLHLQA